MTLRSSRYAFGRSYSRSSGSNCGAGTSRAKVKKMRQDPSTPAHSHSPGIGLSIKGYPSKYYFDGILIAAPVSGAAIDIDVADTAVVADFAIEAQVRTGVVTVAA